MGVSQLAPAGLAEINLINCPLIRKAIYYFLINELAGLVGHIIELSSLFLVYSARVCGCKRLAGLYTTRAHRSLQQPLIEIFIDILVLTASRVRVILPHLPSPILRIFLIFSYFFLLYHLLCECCLGLYFFKNFLFFFFFLQRLAVRVMLPHLPSPILRIFLIFSFFFSFN